MNNSATLNSTILGYEFYNAYKNAGLNPGLVLIALLIGCCAIPGNLFNIFLVYLTIRHKSLRGSSNYLLAQHSLCEFLHQTGHYIFLYTILSGRNFIPFKVSAAFQMQSILGYNSAIFTMIETAVDRFLCVVVPSLHSKLEGPVYLGVYSLLAAIPGVYLAYLVMKQALIAPYEAVTGQLSDVCSPVNVIYDYNLIVCICCFFFYVIIGILVYRKGRSERNTRLFKSLAAIIVIMVGGYFMNTIIRMLVTDVFHFDPIKLWFVNVAGGILVNIGAAANTPILFAFSTEYRKVIKQELKRLFGWIQFRHSQHITTIPVTAINNNSSKYSLTTIRVHPTLATRRGRDLPLATF